jgi:hypothetical protein
MCTAEYVEYRCPSPGCANKVTNMRYTSKDHDPPCVQPTMLPETKVEDRICPDCEKKLEEEKKQTNGGPGYPHLKGWQFS